MDHLEEKFGMTGCILQTLGWVDQDFEQVNATINEDISTLAPELLENLSEEAINDCVANELDDMSQSREYMKMMSCIENYSEEEMIMELLH